jgi:thymidylate kinase
MENIFKKIGYTLSSSNDKRNLEEIKWLQINNPDGTARWIWNASNKQPLFLKFYNEGSFRAKIFALIIKTVFVLKLQKLFFKQSTFYFQKNNNSIFDIKKSWAIFLGTVGPNNKALLFDGRNFTKIATTSNSEKLVENEYQSIKKLNTYSLSFTTPSIVNKAADCLTLSNVSDDCKRFGNIKSIQLNTILELNTIDKQLLPIKEWGYLNELKNQLNAIDNSKIPNNIVRKLKALISDVKPDENIELAFSHGDFTQWNMFEDNNKLSLYDWELASSNKTKGFDYFHYVIQYEVLVNHKSWKEIYTDILFHTNQNKFLDKLFNGNIEELNNYLKWYLIINCINHLDLYASQKDWHIQIYWLINVWNEGLNEFMKNLKSSRQLIIMDFFDAIHNEEYAALKMTNDFPESVSLNSDIDVIIPKKMNKKMVSFLKNHALISQFKTEKKSFMNAIKIVTYENEILALDLIWQLKRKNLEMLNAKKIIAENVKNRFGVKNASCNYTVQYIALFHLLNNAKIPKKYLAYEQIIHNSDDELDLLISECYLNRKQNKAKLLHYLHRQKENRKKSFIINTMNYGLDTIKSYFSNSGFVITFSGVDGVGKSTVIEQIALKIEKQLRKRVIILRHRPSLLPILSVWTKGKEKAHTDVISSLPRQGKNKSVLSSLFRFSYYYFDYLIGQFVIYFKYTLRGHVVIYDRYYFDFINDSRRSNIQLPKFISKSGYLFLLKPKFNFFLFEEAQIILKRKNELNESTINELTKEYKTLFQNLKLKTKTTIYDSIRNENLDTTLNTIITTLIKN